MVQVPFPTYCIRCNLRSPSSPDIQVVLEPIAPVLDTTLVIPQLVIKFIDENDVITQLFAGHFFTLRRPS